MTKAELRRRLVPGTKLVLINCLQGPCNKPRTVKTVRSSSYIMETPEGKESYLYLDNGEKVRETERGFQIIILETPATSGMPAQPERIAAEYIIE